MSEVNITKETDNLENREAELLKEKNKSEVVLIVTTIITMLLIFTSITFHADLSTLLGGVIQVIEVLLLMILMVMFVWAGFRYIDTKDCLKTIYIKKKKGIK